MARVGGEAERSRWAPHVGAPALTGTPDSAYRPG